jgi:hypothetical protein
MSEQAQVSEVLSLSQLPPKVLEEVIRQLRSTRNDIIRYGVWNIRNLSDEDFNRATDQRLFGYFKQDLLETRFLSKGRRVDIVQVWQWFDDQLTGAIPLVVEGQEVDVVIQDKDLEKVRKRIAEIKSFLPALRTDDMDQFRRVKYKLRRTVMRLTYDLHHLYKRLEKHRKNLFIPHDARPTRVPLEAVVDIPEPPPLTGEVGEDTQS